MDVNTNQRDTTPQIVVLDFFEEFVADPDAGEEGGLKAIEFVKWQKKGVQTPAVTIDKIARLKARPAIGKRAARRASPLWEAVEPYYTAWKAGQEPPEYGTPLASWPGCPPPLASALKNFQVRTVEDFIGMPDSQRDRINYPGVRGMVAQAKQFMKSKETKDAVESVLAEKEAENAELRQKVEELLGRVNALAQQAETPKKDPEYQKYTGYQELATSGDLSDDELRSRIEESTGKAPHHKTGRQKLLKMVAELEQAEAA